MYLLLLLLFLLLPLPYTCTDRMRVSGRAVAGFLTFLDFPDSFRLTIRESAERFCGELYGNKGSRRSPHRQFLSGCVSWLFFRLIFW